MKRWEKRALESQGWVQQATGPDLWRRTRPTHAGSIHMLVDVVTYGAGGWRAYSRNQYHATWWEPEYRFETVWAALAWAELNNWGRP